MLKKILIAMSCCMVAGGDANGMQLNSVESIETIMKSPYPMTRRLAALGGALIEGHEKIYTFDVTDRTTAETIVNIFLEEGKKYTQRGQTKTANYIVLLLKNPDDVFCFETSYEMGKIPSKEEYLELERETYSFSEAKAEELEAFIKKYQKN